MAVARAQRTNSSARSMALPQTHEHRSTLRTATPAEREIHRRRLAGPRQLPTPVGPSPALPVRCAPSGQHWKSAVHGRCARLAVRPSGAAVRNCRRWRATPPYRQPRASAGRGSPPAPPRAAADEADRAPRQHAGDHDRARGDRAASSTVTPLPFQATREAGVPVCPVPRPRIRPAHQVAARQQVAQPVARAEFIGASAGWRTSRSPPPPPGMDRAISASGTIVARATAAPSSKRSRRRRSRRIPPGSPRAGRRRRARRATRCDAGASPAAAAIGASGLLRRCAALAVCRTAPPMGGPGAAADPVGRLQHQRAPPGMRSAVAAGRRRSPQGRASPWSSPAPSLWSAATAGRARYIPIGADSRHRHGATSRRAPRPRRRGARRDRAGECVRIRRARRLQRRQGMGRFEMDPGYALLLEEIAAGDADRRGERRHSPPASSSTSTAPTRRRTAALRPLATGAAVALRAEPQAGSCVKLTQRRTATSSTAPSGSSHQDLPGSTVLFAVTIRRPVQEAASHTCVRWTRRRPATSWPERRKLRQKASESALAFQDVEGPAHRRRGRRATRSRCPRWRAGGCIASKRRDGARGAHCAVAYAAAHGGRIDPFPGGGVPAGRGQDQPGGGGRR